MRADPPLGPARRLTDLDALRGLAALAVVLFHYTTRYDQLYGHSSETFMLPWGHYGVQLFFAISGFVIFMTLDRCRSLRDFAVSRFSRLYPAYWAAIFLTTFVVLLWGKEDLVRTPAEILINLSMVQSYVQVEAVDGVYWTLAVELAFYCAAAALWRLGPRRIDLMLIAWMALHWVWTFAPAVVGVEPPWLLGALLVQQHISFFAMGIAAYRLRSGAASAGGAAMIVAAALATLGFCDGMEHLLVGIISAAAIFVVGLARRPLLSARPLVQLGAVSYSLYLLHQFIGFTMISGLEGAGMPATAAIMLTLAVVITLAAIVTSRVEQPALRAIRRRHATRRTRVQARNPVPVPQSGIPDTPSQELTIAKVPAGTHPRLLPSMLAARPGPGEYGHQFDR